MSPNATKTGRRNHAEGITRPAERRFEGFEPGDKLTTLPLTEPVTLLFGANSAGKTRILERCAAAFGYAGTGDSSRARSLWHEPGPYDCFESRISLDFAEVDGSPDRTLLEEVLRAIAEEEQIRTQPGESLLARYRQRLRARLGSGLALMHDDGPVIDSSSSALNESELDRLVGLITSGFELRLEKEDDREHVTLLLSPALSSDDDRRFLERALQAPSRSQVRSVAKQLLAGGPWKVGTGWAYDVSALPSALWLLSDEGGLAEMARKVIDDLLTWVFDCSLVVSARYGRNRSIMEMDQEGSADKPVLLLVYVCSPKPSLPLQPDSWFHPREKRLLPGVASLADLLTKTTNSYLPDFVSQQGQVEITTLEPEYWTTVPERVIVMFRENDGREVDAEVLGAGVRRWVRAALLLASEELRRSRRTLRDPITAWPAMAAHLEEHKSFSVDPPPAESPLRRAPYDQDAFDEFQFDPPADLGIVLIDEPEAHLHPKAIRSAARLLNDRVVPRAVCVLVATHHPMLFDPTLLPNAGRLVIRREGERRTIEQITARTRASLDRLRHELGVSASDLALMTRLALFVEGWHDKIVLEVFFGEEFDRAGVKVVPFHGTNNALALADSEVLWLFDMTVAVLTDNTRLQRVNRGESVSREEKSVIRLLKEARDAGRRIVPFGLNHPDVLYYLSEEVCRQFEPCFPGWQRTWESSRARTGSDWKAWIGEKYPKLRLTRSKVQQLAVQCKGAGLVPEELRGLAARVIETAQRDWEKP